MTPASQARSRKSSLNCDSTFFFLFIHWAMMVAVYFRKFRDIQDQLLSLDRFVPDFPQAGR